MENQLPPQSALVTAISWAALLLALIGLGLLAFYIPLDRRVFVQLFADFRWKVPPSTELMLAIPDIAFPVVAAAIALVLVLLQWFVRAKAAVALFHMLTVVLCCAAFVVYRELLVQPLSALLRGLAH
jgi:hypothetical protein